MNPSIISGACHTDSRGIIQFNNDFNCIEVKRIYLIENADVITVRAWQGHKIEQRWFSVIKGSFEIQLIAVDDWEMPSKKCKKENFVLNEGTLDVLHVPAGYVSSIQALVEGSKLLVMADYLLGEIADDYKFSKEYFL